MNLCISRCIAVFFAACFMALPTVAKANEEAEKVQKITFIEDDAQKNMASKIYVLKYMTAADVAPFIRGAVTRYCKESKVSAISDKANKRQMLLVSTGINNIPYVDKLVVALDRKASLKGQLNIVGDGVAYGTYQPNYRAGKVMLDILVKAGITSSSADDCAIKFDRQRNMFYYKDTPATVEEITDKLMWLDKEIPQARVELTLYEVRDSDLKDVGMDYLAWKNGPGLNLFNMGYLYNRTHVRDTVWDSLANLTGLSKVDAGGFFSTPIFDMSFIRLLQQNGKATISSSAIVAISNIKDKTFNVSFAPEFQNIVKDANHSTSVDVSKNASLTADIKNVTITSGKNGVVVFDYEVTNNNIIERNNLGAQLTSSDKFSASTTLNYNKEKVLAMWSKTSKVKQTIGVPFLCELPILKYIFGTTTENNEVTRCIVTARVVPVHFNENIKPGTVAQFDKVCKK